MKIYLIDDGYQWYFAAESADEALEHARKCDVDEEENLTADDLIEFGPGAELTFHIGGDFDPDTYDHDADIDHYPRMPVKNECGYWVVTASAHEWVARLEPGALVAAELTD
jgi:hypothetical protein